jgi:hypothetical protein
MIAYRHPSWTLAPAERLRALRSRAATLPTDAHSRHDHAVALLVDLGVLEAAVADALLPEADGPDPAVDRLRAATCAAGRLVAATWRDDTSACRRRHADLTGALDHAAELPLPARAEASDPEGFSYFGLYPEMFFGAAAEAVKATGMRTAIVLGIRGIGTSLSALVAAALGERGVDAWTATVRPRGHPFDRRPVLAESLACRIRRSPGRYVLVVDEGPGLSGSSFGGTARVLGDLGVPDDRILFLPSWRGDPSAFRSPTARERWRRHRSFVGSFEDAWLRSGRLERLAGGLVDDVSAGAWRSRMLGDSRCWPAAHPQHERRKLLVRESQFAAPRAVLKFVGFGERAWRLTDEAQGLGDAGVSPRIIGSHAGLTATEYVHGEPLLGPTSDAGLMEAAAHYLTYRGRSAAASADLEALRAMAQVNIEEALGGEGLAALRHQMPSAEAMGSGRVVRCDGRMLPHEWRRTSWGWLKTDAIDHGDDEFFPGPCDIAWDVAAAALELCATRDVRRGLVDRYRQLSGDADIARRLPFWTAAYLAARLGYVTLAAESLGHTDDGHRFRREQHRYARLLAEELATGSAAWAA